MPLCEGGCTSRKRKRASMGVRGALNRGSFDFCRSGRTSSWKPLQTQNCKECAREHGHPRPGTASPQSGRSNSARRPWACRPRFGIQAPGLILLPVRAAAGQPKTSSDDGRRIPIADVVVSPSEDQQTLRESCKGSRDRSAKSFVVRSRSRQPARWRLVHSEGTPCWATQSTSTLGQPFGLRVRRQGVGTVPRQA